MSIAPGQLACATEETKPLIKSVCEAAPIFLFWVPTCLSMDREWPVKKAIVDIPKGIRLKGNLKHSSSNSLSSLGAQKRDLRATSQKLLINNLFLLKLKITGMSQ